MTWNWATTRVCIRQKSAIIFWIGVGLLRIEACELAFGSGKNPFNWYINRHLKTCVFILHLCLLTGIYVFPRCRCIFTWSSFLRYHDLSLKNDPDVWDISARQSFPGSWIDNTRQTQNTMSLKIWGPSIDEKIIAEKLLMTKNNWGNDRQVMNSNGHVQHKHGKQSVGMDHFSKSVAVMLPIFSTQFLLYIKNSLKCEVQSCDVLPTK